MKKNRLLFSGLSLGLLLFLSGCVKMDKATGLPAETGWVNQLIYFPITKMLQFFAVDQSLGFGLAIIIVTIIVRTLIILPLGLYQSAKTTYQTEKRNYFSHIFEPINERMRTAKTQEEKLAAQTELMAVQKHYGISMLGGMGCLPLFIQIPFFSALFYATRYADGIKEASFLWFQLGKSGDLILTAIIAALYLLQAKMSMATVPKEQQEQMKTAMYTTPIMMVFFAFSSSNGVALYWLIGGVMVIIQQLIVNFVIKPKMKAKVEEEYRLNPPAPYRPQAATGRPKDVTPTASSAITTNKQKRNAGKQNRKK
jgi:YidC/Oxa1 family membrane protein insertase